MSRFLSRLPSRLARRLSASALALASAFAGAFAAPVPKAAARPALDAALAARYFEEARALCRRDGGRLWGRSLCGPMMFADPSTRAVFASEPDAAGALKPSGAVYVGVLPATVNIANTAAEWSGVEWMLVTTTALPAEDRHARARVLMHELWHLKQGRLGFPASGAANDHLDTREGRLWLQLEWRALASALGARGRARRRAAADALTFRAYRRSLFPRAAAEQEREMELHEGLAEYTGVRLSGAPDPARFVVAHNFREGAARASFVRSFAYASGPAYGLLLDEAAPGWTRGLRRDDDLGALLRRRLGASVPRDLARVAAERARAYDGESLTASEREREEGRRQLLAGYRARLVEGPVLALPLLRMRMSFDPGTLTPLEGLGTVYPTIRVVDEWGVLAVAGGGALMNTTFSGVSVTAPADADARPVRGDGWTLELKDGWTLAPGERAGDIVLKRRR